MGAMKANGRDQKRASLLDKIGKPRTMESTLKMLKSEITMLTKEEASLPIEDSCVLCLVNRRTHAPIPCGHKMYCPECVPIVKAKKICFCCTLPFKSIQKID